ncbi:hypothetical protein SDC9_149799 [bioreactor metagenome]|uniref:Uncharacterized protein n=1 Tax=bioreactor metagenome TaxID=1076179 RepID=A0A645EPX3_9ZZZZ
MGITVGCYDQPCAGQRHARDALDELEHEAGLPLLGQDQPELEGRRILRGQKLELERCRLHDTGGQGQREVEAWDGALAEVLSQSDFSLENAAGRDLRWPGQLESRQQQVDLAGADDLVEDTGSVEQVLDRGSHGALRGRP